MSRPSPRPLRRSAPVRVGQVWADNDKRANGRLVEVLAILVDDGVQYALVRQTQARKVGEGGLSEQNRPGRKTRIRVDRFQPQRQTGYTLVQDARPDDELAGDDLRRSRRLS
ncbi:MAG TPA: hypothetical protein VGL32_02075 [Acidimicrobiales bacterium]|jgi:hypothetical protein